MRICSPVTVLSKPVISASESGTVAVVSLLYLSFSTPSVGSKLSLPSRYSVFVGGVIISIDDSERFIMVTFIEVSKPSYFILSEFVPTTVLSKPDTMSSVIEIFSNVSLSYVRRRSAPVKSSVSLPSR